MKRILILGGGYGGLKCAVNLDRKLDFTDTKVTLISKHDYHYQSTLLHKVAVGTYSARKARMFYRNLLKNVEFIKDDISQIDIANRCIKGIRACYEYDYLVISLGFAPNTFNLPGINEYSHSLSSLNSALTVRKIIEDNFKNYPYTLDDNSLKIAVCGSGFTGVEFSAELAHRLNNLCQICGVNKDLVKINLIGRGKQILPMFDENLSQIALKKLEKIGVNFISANVVECQKDGVIIERKGKKEKIPAGLVLWSAGIMGNETIANSNLPSTNNRIKVDKFLRFKDDIFVIGDCAIANEKDIIHAPTAQLASQMGEFVAEALMRLTKGKDLKKEFHFIHRGTVCSVGHTDGVGVVFGLKIHGELAAFLKNIIENRWILSVSNLANVIKKGQFRFRSSD